MKYLIVMSLLGAVATATFPPVDKDALEKDLLDIFSLRSKEEVDKIFNAYLEHDEELNNLLNYAGSEEFDNLVTDFLKTKEAIALLQYLDESGLKIYDYIKILTSGLGIKHLLPTEKSALKEVEITGGLNGLAEDIAKLTPFDEIKKLHEEKLKISSHYAYFISRVTSDEFSILTVDAGFTVEFLKILESMDNAQIDVPALKKLFCVNVGIRDC